VAGTSIEPQSFWLIKSMIIPFNLLKAKSSNP
jgi:hypothetical protein